MLRSKLCLELDCSFNLHWSLLFTSLKSRCLAGRRRYHLAHTVCNNDDSCTVTHYSERIETSLCQYCVSTLYYPKAEINFYRVSRLPYSCPKTLLRPHLTGEDHSSSGPGSGPRIDPQARARLQVASCGSHEACRKMAKMVSLISFARASQEDTS